MTIGFRLNEKKKRNLATIIALIFTAFLLLILALRVYELLTPKKIIKVTPYQHLETDKHMNYEFSIKKFNKLDTIFITENQKRIYLFDCSNYLETICTHDQDQVFNYQIKTADIIKINDRFMIKHMTWVNAVNKKQFQHTLADHQLMKLYEAKSNVSYVAIAVFLLLSFGGLFMIFWGHIYQFILRKFNSL
ncbi:MAG: hypothetical protein BGN93_11810 [Acinetobacter sp. 39-4]|nr:MAG: hypothetical protein BGN93_11810 [Acinetobacter sp. 39-4]